MQYIGISDYTLKFPKAVTILKHSNATIEILLSYKAWMLNYFCLYVLFFR